MTTELDALRALVEGDFAKHEQMTMEAGATDGLAKYGAVIGAAFFIAVRRHFGKEHTNADVVRLVAEVRALFDQSGDSIDPRSAELVVRSALGERDVVSQVPDGTVIQTQMVVVSYFVAQQAIGEPDQFMSEVETLVDRWTE